jgi:SNF2 family DNA or RNA helicase
MQNADITIINRENLGWLIDESGFPFDFDMVILDELSSFKNHRSKRFRSMMKVRPNVKRIVGLTGTPSSNGLMDLWAEFRLLDMGQRLGRFITQYRHHLPGNFGYHDFHEVDGSPKNAKAHQQRI